MLEIKEFGTITDKAISTIGWTHDGCEMDIEFDDLTPALQSKIITDIKTKYSKYENNICDLFISVIINIDQRVISPYLIVYIESESNIDDNSLQYDINIGERGIKDFINQVLVPFFNGFTYKGVCDD